MTSVITGLIVNGISAHSILLDSYVVLHAALISSLHKLIGIEFGTFLHYDLVSMACSILCSPAAYFVQNVVADYEKHFIALQDARADHEAPNSDGPGTEDPRGKEASNLIVLLSELYNFQVISCLLIYDIIRGLLEGSVTELKVELLLKITRSTTHLYESCITQDMLD